VNLVPGPSGESFKRRSRDVGTASKQPAEYKQMKIHPMRSSHARDGMRISSGYAAFGQHAFVAEVRP